MVEAGVADVPVGTPVAVVVDDEALVAAFLREHPAWLSEHPELYRVLAPPERVHGDGLADHMAARGDRERSFEQQLGEALQLEARRHHDAFDRLGRIRCPTLVAAGRFDATARPENSEAITVAVPGAELRIYEGGHLFLLQDPRAVAEIMDFLAASR